LGRQKAKIDSNGRTKFYDQCIIIHGQEVVGEHRGKKDVYTNTELDLRENSSSGQLALRFFGLATSSPSLDNTIMVGDKHECTFEPKYLSRRDTRS